MENRNDFDGKANCIEMPINRSQTLVIKKYFL